MPPIELRPVSEWLRQVERVLDCVLAQLRALLPNAELYHIGATALPGAVSKGDVDILVRVAPADFGTAVESLRQVFVRKQPANWSAAFASFGDDVGYALPLGIQVVVKDSEDDFLLFLHDYFLSHREALEEYNRLKWTHASAGAEGYWKAKDAFLSRILASRPDRSG